MTTHEERTWRDAKVPQWAKDSIADELRAHQLTAALAWPTEAKPEPLPFQWGGYDRLIGEPREGSFWRIDGRYVGAVHIRKTNGWRSWEFSSDGREWSTSVRRGPLFESEHEACLYQLWCECERFAGELLALRGRMK